MQKDLIIRYKFWQAMGNLGLFDYKDFSLKFQEGATITESGILFQNNQNSSLLFVMMDNVPKNGEIQSFTPLFSIQSNGKQYKITDIKNEKEPLSEICSKHFQYKMQGIELYEGSILKIGKVHVKILAIELNQQKKQFDQMSFKEPAIKKISQHHYIEENQSIIQQINLSKSANTTATQKQIIQSTKYSLVEENPCCRICYGKTIKNDNNFTMLCKCEGFTKYIHQKCLAEWLFMKGKFFTEKFGKNSQTLIYTAQKTAFQCEICKTSYPLSQLLQLMTRNFEDPGKFKPLKKFKKFFSFQVTTSESTKIFIVDLQQLHQIKIGRLNQCDIYIPDLSISRQHCTIHLTKKNGKETLIVKDNQSKFGTIIKKSSIVIKKSEVLYLQKGKNVFEIKQKQRKAKFWKKMLGMCAPDIDLAE